MNCNHCGAEIKEGEPVCPKCGYILYEEGPKIPNNTINNDNQQTNNENNIETEKQKEEYRRISVFPFIIIFIFVLGFFLYKNGMLSSKLFPTLNSKDTINYAGYKIPILDGYEAKIKKKELYISNDTNEYLVMIDYTYSYDENMKQMSKESPKMAEYCRVKIDNKEYCGVLSNREIMIYSTNADPSYTFIGRIKKKENMYSKDDLNDLNKMLSKAKLVKKDESYDYGGDEYVDLIQIFE